MHHPSSTGKAYRLPGAANWSSNALKKSVDEVVGETALAEWLRSQQATKGRADESAPPIVDTLWPMVERAQVLTLEEDGC